MREQVLYSVLVGLAVAAVLALPLTVWQYRKYGRVSTARSMVVVAALIYTAAVVAFTMFPLPSLTPRWCELYAVTEPVLRPFAFVSDISRDTAGMSAVGVLTSSAVMQVVLNVALFVPFGVFGLVLFECSRAATIAAAVAVSGLIELTQFTAVWGVFPCAYRVADVNDVLLNTAGAVVGVVLVGLAPQLVPSRRLLAAGRPLPRPVTAWRRWVGMAVDVTAFVGVFVTAAVVVQLGMEVVGVAVDADTARAVAALSAIAAVVGPGLIGSGASLGQRVVWLRPQWPTGPTAGARTARALSVAGVGAVLVFVATPAAMLWLVVAAASVPLTRGNRGLSGVLSGADMVDARVRPEPAEPADVRVPVDAGRG
ncbi:VanZ family protein [Rhodococcus maanshanensis]|uniref:Glycopeptide antibiotics resistance protein n=1 Tax=Rhodococcus maanshanensis TaxID=183556 RepID=A0A1H7RK01_9NOCA|nr:VanZ family protein [Rhodococcus maanshanensis]SEL60174.1 Glycopeptide antibiotics resistance protein [Rhodococcus maanshanensis]